jgi:peptidoglycan/xylan/chitin deacetylase (PgdA/CDA1 family)
LSWGVGRWAQDRRDRLLTSGGEISFRELLTGQLSISRANYERLGGFDQSFTRGGMFGGEDTDFGYRALRAGLRPVFNPSAISYQYYDVDPGEYLRRVREAGRSSHELLLKHPEQAHRFGRVADFKRRRDRWLLTPFVFAPEWASWPLRTGVAALARTGHLGPRLRTLFFAVRSMERLRGLRLARQATFTGRAVTLAYHGIANLSHDPILARYTVAPQRFAAQLDWLLARGWKFVALDTVLDALAGKRSMPRRTVLVTFDDGYADFIEEALPILRGRGIPAVMFAVAGRIGETNTWDAEIGAEIRRLMDRDQLLAIAAAGTEVASHGMWHRALSALDPTEFEADAVESAEQIEALGLPRPRVFSYPYGESSADAPAVLRRAGYAAAFGIAPGVIERSTDRYRLPRIQVSSTDTPLLLWLKLLTIRWPARWREAVLRRVAARVSGDRE